MSLVYKVGKGWQFSPRAENLGRERTNFTTGGYVWARKDRNGNPRNVGFSDGPNRAPGVYNFRFEYNTSPQNVINQMRGQGFRSLGNVNTGIENQRKNYEGNANRNTANSKINQARAAEEAENRRDNNAERKVLQIADGTAGMDYLTQRKAIENISIDKTLKDGFLKDYKNFYITEKLKKWDTKLGALDPIGKFDGKYYRGENSSIDTEWAQAKADDNVDVIERFGSANNLAWFNYTQKGKSEGKRGSAAEATQAANVYKEKPPTDAEAE